VPIYEFECHACGKRFELLVLKATVPACPDCRSSDIERLHSLFGVSSEATQKANLESARRANRRVQRDRLVAEHEEIHHHHDDDRKH
jgi:putative FmdB family regulatory protein